MIERQATILLDTSAVVAAFRNIPEVVQRLAQARTMITSVVLAELVSRCIEGSSDTEGDEQDHVALAANECGGQLRSTHSPYLRSGSL